MHPSRPEVGREQAARHFRKAARVRDESRPLTPGLLPYTEADAYAYLRDAEWRRRWHALVVDGMTTTDAQREARAQMHAEGWWA